MTGFLAFLLTICTIPLPFALRWDGAGATAFSASPGWNPKPTAAHLGPYDLRRRQQQTYIYDNACGYLSGATGRYSPFHWCHLPHRCSIYCRLRKLLGNMLTCRKPSCPGVLRRVSPNLRLRHSLHWPL